jgi:hypothetical protein
LESPDVILFGFKKVNITGASICEVGSNINKMLDLTSAKDDLFAVFNSGIGLAVWDKLIKKAIILENSIFFHKMRNAEDFVFCIDVFSKCKMVKVINEFFYNYRIQVGGKRNDNYELSKNHLIAMERLLTFSISENKKKQIRIFF